VLANGLPFVKDVIEESCAGLTYDYRDPSTVRDAVRRLTDSAFRGRCAASALAYARSTFNWQTQARVLLELYAGRTGPLVSGATVAVAGEVVPAT
jgi:glycosyltransferase involved in cell wall biosynthesis